MESGYSKIRYRFGGEMGDGIVLALSEARNRAQALCCPYIEDDDIVYDVSGTTLAQLMDEGISERDFMNYARQLCYAVNVLENAMISGAQLSAKNIYADGDKIMIVCSPSHGSADYTEILRRLLQDMLACVHDSGNTPREYQELASRISNRFNLSNIIRDIFPGDELDSPGMKAMEKEEKSGMFVPSERAIKLSAFDSLDKLLLVNILLIIVCAAAIIFVWTRISAGVMTGNALLIAIGASIIAEAGFLVFYFLRKKITMRMMKINGYRQP